MKNRCLIWVVISTTGFWFFSPGLLGAGVILYEQGFESGDVTIAVPEPIWNIKKPTVDNIGPGNLFEVVSDVAHTGKYSLRFNYDGRNGICNTCGSSSRSQHGDASGVNYFVDSEGLDIAQEPIYASPNRVVYNITGGYSKWNITSLESQNAVNDKLVLEKLADSIDGGSASFNANDKVNIYRVCGVDGLIGGKIDRRSDCNQAITYMGGVSQLPGQSIFRRMYLRIGLGSILPRNQKLRYWHTSTGPLYSGFQVDSGTGLPYPWVSAPSVGGPGLVKTGVLMQYDTWYYFEEEFRAESSDSANDGEYRLWVAKSGDIVEAPLVELKEIDLGVVEETSLWGNHQHSEDAHGFWYIDDFKISNVRIGPQDGTAPPKAPNAHGDQ